jgi:beta-lactam-binding protein with PASTA domain
VIARKLVLALAVFAAAGCTGPAGPGAPVSVPEVPTLAPPSDAVKVLVIPDVVGMDHQKAQDTLQAAGFYYLTEEDSTGQGRMLVSDRNWVVVEQVPAAGAAVPQSDKVLLRSKKKTDP